MLRVIRTINGNVAWLWLKLISIGYRRSSKRCHWCLKVLKSRLAVCVVVFWVVVTGGGQGCSGATLSIFFFSDSEIDEVHKCRWKKKAIMTVVTGKVTTVVGAVILVTGAAYVTDIPDHRSRCRVQNCWCWSNILVHGSRLIVDFSLFLSNSFSSCKAYSSTGVTM